MSGSTPGSFTSRTESVRRWSGAAALCPRFPTVKVLLKMLVLVVCGVASVSAITVGVASWDGSPAWFALFIFAGPFLGTFLGGWLVSRGSTSGAKVGWIVGGGIGFGVLVWLGLITLLAILAISACHGYEVC